MLVKMNKKLSEIGNASLNINMFRSSRLSIYTRYIELEQEVLNVLSWFSVQFVFFEALFRDSIASDSISDPL